MIEKIKTGVTAGVGVGGFATQYIDQIDAVMKLVIGLLSIAWLVMQMFYKWRRERGKGRV
tara:strand:+ start:450 stop:629 length:180 start_codon:yes stop_codon:yes gene_type:complete